MTRISWSKLGLYGAVFFGGISLVLMALMPSERPPGAPAWMLYSAIACMILTICSTIVWLSPHLISRGEPLP